MALPLLIGCLLFFCAGRITNRVFDAPVATVARPEVSKVEGAALFVLGCYLLALAIVDAIYNSAKLLLPWWLSPALNPSLAIPEYALLFRTIAQFAIAFTLIFGFRGIVALKDRLLGPTTD